MTAVLVGSALVGAIAVYIYQLRFGTYLGRGWVIAALAGAATGAGLSAAAVISGRRHSPAAGRLLLAWLVLGLASASAIRFPFPQGPYGTVQAFFNVAHAAMLGYETVIGTAIVALMAYVGLRPRSAARLREAGTGQAGKRLGPGQFGNAGPQVAAVRAVAVPVQRAPAACRPGSGSPERSQRPGEPGG